MISRDTFKHHAREKYCVVCSHLPRAERPQFREELDEVPFENICLRCWNAYWKGFCIFGTEEELQAIRQERRRALCAQLGKSWRSFGGRSIERPRRGSQFVATDFCHFGNFGVTL